MGFRYLKRGPAAHATPFRPLTLSIARRDDVALCNRPRLPLVRSRRKLRETIHLEKHREFPAFGDTARPVHCGLQLAQARVSQILSYGAELCKATSES